MKKYVASCFLVFISIALAAAPASATILFAGGEDLDFTGNGSAISVSTSTGFNSTYSRESVYSTYQNGSYYIVTPVFTSSSTFWVHFDYLGTSFYNNPLYWIALLDSSGIPRIYIETTHNMGNNVTSGVTINKANAAGTVTLLATSAGTVYITPESTVDLYVNYGASGTITLYQNGAPIVTYSGDVTTDGNTALAQLWLGANTYNQTYYSQVIVSTLDSRAMHLATIPPAANGNTMAWTGTVGNINATSYNDSNVISSATSGQLAEFTASALPTGSYSIAAVVQSARASATVGGIQNLQFDTRTGGTSYQSANQTLSPGMSHYAYIWSTNPNTGVAWTTSDLGAAGFNLGVESQT